MNYTLDSKEHVISCLKEKLKVKQIISTPLLCNLEELTNKNKNIYYFGILTAGDNIEKIKLNAFDSNFIDIKSNSQIISLFDSIEIIKIQQNTENPKGQFRGFTLKTENSSY